MIYRCNWWQISLYCIGYNCIYLQLCCKYLQMCILQLIRDICNLFQISVILLEISSNTYKYLYFIWEIKISAIRFWYMNIFADINVINLLISSKDGAFMARYISDTCKSFAEKLKIYVIKLQIRYLQWITDICKCGLNVKVACRRCISGQTVWSIATSKCVLVSSSSVSRIMTLLRRIGLCYTCRWDDENFDNRSELSCFLYGECRYCRTISRISMRFGLELGLAIVN